MRLFISCFLLTGLLACLQGVVAQSSNPSNSVEEKKRVALVIGNQQYENLDPLSTPINDAQDMTEALTRLGFSIVALVQNAVKNDMETAIDDFANNLDEHTEALFYFSGHGGQNRRSQSLLYPIDMPVLIGIDADEAEKSAINLNHLLNKMKDKGAPVNVIILDACRESLVSVKVASGLGAGDNVDYTGQRRLSDGFLIAYATAPGTLSAGGNTEGRRNSKYTGFLLKNLFYPGPAYFVFERIRQDVIKNRSTDEELQYQLPWESNSLQQTFYFVPRKLHVHGGFQ